MEMLSLIAPDSLLEWFLLTFAVFCLWQAERCKRDSKVAMLETVVEAQDTLHKETMKKV